MKVRFLSPAEDEILESVAFYFAESPRATAAFLDEIERAVEAIGRSPYMYSIYSDEVRVKQLERFPFSIFYRIDNEEAVIQSVAHTSRRPDWKDRKSLPTIPASTSSLSTRNVSSDSQAGFLSQDDG